MDTYVTGNTIKTLREKMTLTQKELADRIGVSDKTISKWESGRGLPDISLIEPLAVTLKISVAELLSGSLVCNQNRCGNMLHSKFYVCPICGNVIHTTGESSVNCCGITLPVLTAEEADSEHIISVERVENEYYVTVNHEMSKNHYISFISYLTLNHYEMIKLYPQGNAEGRFLMKGHGKIFAYCNHHGLFAFSV